jgi:hypothetical protein
MEFKSVTDVTKNAFAFQLYFSIGKAIYGRGIIGSFMVRIVKFLGSLPFAIILIGSLASILVISTLLESFYGTPFAQRFFYQAGWFDVFLGLFWVNIFCATLLRWPFKKHHIGFIVTHIGLLTFLIGSLLARVFGIEGQMTLYEGQSQNQILQPQYELSLYSPDSHKGIAVDLNSKIVGKSKVAVISGQTVSFQINRILENAVEESKTVNDPSAPKNAAIHLWLKSERAGADESLCLVENDPTNPGSASVSVGPATLELRRSKPARKNAAKSSSQQFQITDRRSGESVSIDLEHIPKELVLGNSGMKLSDFHYFPDARVEDNELLSVSDEPKNPAIEFKVADAKGHEKKFVHFAIFPDFESIHGRKDMLPIDLEMEFLLPENPMASASSPTLIIYAPENDGIWRYESRSSKGRLSGEIKPGESHETGWMDFRFEVRELLENAVVKPEIKPSEAEGRKAAELSVWNHAGKLVFKDWLIEDRRKTFAFLLGKKCSVGLFRKTSEVPFKLELKDFRKVDYPGTNKPQSFESDVILSDAAKAFKIETTIKMNEPLDHKGYRIFQSSYMQDPDGTEASVFTVAKNPGIFWIYLGAGILFSGIVLLFYINPLSNDKGSK